MVLCLLGNVAGSACTSKPTARLASDEPRDREEQPPKGQEPRQEEESPEASEFSTAELMLRTTDGVYLHEFSFQVTKSDGQTIQEGSFSIPGEGAQTKLALELPVGTGYEVSITGEGSVGEESYPCAGQAFFDVLRDELTNIELDIECVVPEHVQPGTGGVEITATVVTVAPFVDECGIDGLIVGPTTVAPGGFITAQGTAVPTTSTFTWSATEGLYGTFTNPSAGNDVLTTFRCFGGSGNIVLVVSSELCTDQFSVPVSCGPAGICGDGIVQTYRGEVCDDGNSDDGDTCSSACQPTSCGDGVLNEGEACDDGNITNEDGCSHACVLEECGDGISQTDEECDDGNSDDNDACTNECRLPPHCGDGIPQSGEECDYGNQTDDDGCSNDCHLNACGNGLIEPAFDEQCDDGNTQSGDGCNADCFTEHCGDGVLQKARGELCDDGNTLGGDGCNAGCFTEYCGDGVVQPKLGERCDSSSGCSAECAFLADCGDGEVNLGEMCDDGDNVDGDGCSAICVSESCGDGALQVSLGEACDDGNILDGDGCSAQCANELCGDAIIQNEEVCDDGNTVNGDGCTNVCQSEYCGDGVAQPSEACDDGNLDSGDGCSNVCTFEGSDEFPDGGIASDEDFDEVSVDAALVDAH